MLVQLQELVVGNLYALLMYWLRQRTKSQIKTNPLLALSQEELNKIYLGPDFELSSRYANALSIFFVCYMFSTGLPILLFICTCNFLITYWKDKFLFIEFYRTPPRYTDEISKLSTSILKYALVVHLIISLWTLCIDEYFESPNVGYQEYVNDFTDQAAAATSYSRSVKGKITQVHTLPLFLLLLIMVSASILFIFFRKLYDGLWKHFLNLLGMKSVEDDIKNMTNVYGDSARETLTYSQAVRFGRFKSLATYNILLNPMYQGEFAIDRYYRKKKKITMIFIISFTFSNTVAAVRFTSTLEV